MPRKKSVPPPAPPPPPALKSGFIAIVGRTNVGKSTLLNQALGKKVSIISDKPQTTRTRILGVHTTPAGQMVFFDTPGVHRPGHELNRQMVQHIHHALQGADAVLQVIDISESFGHGEQYVLDLVRAAGRPAVLAINKIDLVDDEYLEEVREKFKDWDPVLISAAKNIGIDELKAKIFERLKLIRIYMKKQGQEADMDVPLIAKKGSTVGDVCDSLHRVFRQNFRYALVWGDSARFPGQMVGLEHRLADGDVLSIIIRRTGE